MLAVDIFPAVLSVTRYSIFSVPPISPLSFGLVLLGLPSSTLLKMVLPNGLHGPGSQCTRRYRYCLSSPYRATEESSLSSDIQIQNFENRRSLDHAYDLKE